jgi:basic membrane lipoprotein Med (substrate-binding protein (PBP1-ABC) superfamily)/DNA-binding SARP family transcriptional activator
MNVSLLGTLRVEVNGSPVDLGPPKQRALLALLALNVNQVVATERLIDLIWGDDPPRTAAHSLQIYVSSLRKVLGARSIETRAPGYLLLLDPGDVDAARFQRLVEENQPDQLRAALGMWHGEPLADFAYEEWAQPHIRRLRGLHDRAVELLAEAELEAGRAPEVVGMLENLIEHDPLREASRRLLMLALYRSGRQAEALRTFREFRLLLGEELGVEPSPALYQLEEQILLQDPGLAPPPLSQSKPARNPYKGLGSFDELDAGDFFGRDKLIAEMVDVLTAGSRLLVLVGPSGSGKSSVVRAGLIPAVRRGQIPGSDHWSIATMAPGVHPFEQLEAALVRAGLTASGGGLADDDTGLLRVALTTLPEHRSELVLVVDQFEELFTSVGEKVRRRFLDSLVVAATEPRSPIRLILTLRADFYDRPLLSHRFAPVFAANVVNVIPLTPAELEAAIVLPAAQEGIAVEPALLAHLISDMGEDAAALPLLQYTLTNLVESAPSDQLSLDAYRRLGGIHSALTLQAETLFSSLSAAQQDTLRRIMLGLVSWERGNDPTRRRVLLRDLRRLGGADKLIATLISHRLVVADRDPISGEATIQVTHEALLEGWDRLRNWIDVYASDLERSTAITAAAAEWEASGRDPDYLLTGGRLTILADWASETDLSLPTVACEFLDASTEQQSLLAGEDEERRRREDLVARRARRRLWGLAAAVAVAAAATVYAVLSAIPERPPPIAMVTLGPDGGIGELMMDGYDRAAADLGPDLAAYQVPFDPVVASAEIDRLSSLGVESVFTGFYFFHPGVEEAAVKYPDVDYVVLDVSGSLWSNVQYVAFKVEEAAYLAGAIAALKSETGKIGFVGGIDIPPVRSFYEGYRAGAVAIRPDVEIVVVYLTPEWEHSGFSSEILAQIKTEPIYQAGVDVVFHAAGHSGLGVFEAAAVESERQGRHLWVIGVDADEYNSVLNLSHYDSGGPDPRRWQPHILTSVLKRFDVVTYQVLTELGRGQFEGGDRLLGLAEDAVGYSTTGGFIDDLVPMIEALKAQVISGEITVPTTS